VILVGESNRSGRVIQVLSKLISIHCIVKPALGQWLGIRLERDSKWLTLTNMALAQTDPGNLCQNGRTPADQRRNQYKLRSA
jgi:hypothetical protein